MSKPCKLSQHQGLGNWCERHGMWHNGPNLAYSQGDDEISIKHRLWWDGVLDPEGNAYKAPPRRLFGWVVAAWRYSIALIAHTFGGFNYADWPTVWRRRRICNACPQRDPATDSCRVCGCNLGSTIIGDKLRWKSSECPRKKW